MKFSQDIKDEIQEIFSQSGERLSDVEVEEIAQNLLSFALHVTGIEVK